MQQGKYGVTRYGFENAEAFMLMKYQSKDGTVTELLWNSRDGVTPFGIMAQEGEAECHRLTRMSCWRSCAVEKLSRNQLTCGAPNCRRKQKMARAKRRKARYA
ncbi:MAG TPA: hypothetical protein VN579_07475 [Bryobacteraceae bacterium]|nr:hypothetical protein [Bryobacteraceae bacterium]